jgi:2-polyprenyl-3-methyl-5-hydroxy-6-metoxy-1,4-benzoquinol methylase
MQKANINCINCASKKLFFFFQFKKLLRVSSDSKFFKKNGNITICKNCGLIQKIIDQQYLNEIRSIYSMYEMYKLTKGEDQMLAGGNETRANKILKIINKNFKLKNNGDLLDIGCGTGGFLHEFGKKYRLWNLHGYEINKKNITLLNKIKNFKSLYIAKPDKKFDFISIIHTFEHITDHHYFFKFIKSICKANTKIFIQIPNFKNSIYDILIADHTAHYDKNTILSTIKKFMNIKYYSEEIDKEISVMGTIKKKFSLAKKNSMRFTKNYKKLKDRIKYLNNLLNKINNINTKFYVYGTTIASSWITGNFKLKIKGYVEDDIRKINKNFYDKKIFNMKSLDKDKSPILLPFSSLVIKKIIKKNIKYKNKFIFLND